MKESEDYLRIWRCERGEQEGDIVIRRIDWQKQCVRKAVHGEVIIFVNGEKDLSQYSQGIGYCLLDGIVFLFEDKKLQFINSATKTFLSSFLSLHNSVLILSKVALCPNWNSKEVNLCSLIQCLSNSIQQYYNVSKCFKEADLKPEKNTPGLLGHLRDIISGVQRIFLLSYKVRHLAP